MELFSSNRVRTAKSAQSGQIGIIVVLIMVVLLTIGLALASRTTKEVALTTQEQQSTQVFNAAEAGVEQALSSNLNFSGDVFTSSPINPAGTNSTVTYTINKQYQLEMQVFQGLSSSVPLVDATHLTPPPALYIDWSVETSCTTQVPAALLVSIYSVNTTTTPQTVKVRYLSFDPCSRSNNFGVAGMSASPISGYFKRATIALGATDTTIRIKPIYNDTKMLVQPSAGQMPVQSYAIRSSGNNNFGTENRNVQVVRTLPSAPSVLDYVLLSGNTIVK